MIICLFYIVSNLLVGDLVERIYICCIGINKVKGCSCCDVRVVFLGCDEFKFKVIGWLIVWFYM